MKLKELLGQICCEYDINVWELDKENNKQIHTKTVSGYDAHKYDDCNVGRVECVCYTEDKADEYIRVNSKIVINVLSE